MHGGVPNACRLCYMKLMYNTIYKHLGSHNALKYRKLLDLFTQRAWRWPNKGRNMSPWQYAIFNVYKIKCCVIDWHDVFIGNIQSYIALLSKYTVPGYLHWWRFTAIRFYEIHDAFNQAFILLRINIIVVSATNIKPINLPYKKKARYQYQRYQHKTVKYPAQNIEMLNLSD